MRPPKSVPSILRLAGGVVALVALLVVSFAPCVAQDAQRPALGQPALPQPTAPRKEIVLDEFHPDRAPRADGTRPSMPAPAYGGRVVVQMEAMPKSLCYALESSGVIRRLLYELHETLLLRDWDTCALRPVLCRAWTVEDRLVPVDAASGSLPFGAVSEEGDGYRVTPVSRANPLRAPTLVPKASVARVERGTVFTFELRDDVRWHDGERFTARDVAFSLSIYANPGVRCDDKRFAYADVTDVTVIDDLTVRVTYGKTYFMAEASLGDLFLLPAHLYDLSHPDHPRFDPDYHAHKKQADPSWKPSREDEAAYVNENPHNRAFVGLGPYQLAEYGSDSILAKRFAGYFDPSNGGWVDEIRWRALPDPGAAFRAFQNGDLDFFDMVTTDDWFSSAVESEAFRARAYKGWHDTAVYWYVGWNCKRPKLADPAVRRALAHVFDFEEFRRTFYRGLATRVTGMFSPRSPAYDAGIAPWPHDPERAKKMLFDAGWYDRDGDGIVDHDGEPLEIELLVQAGNAVGKAFGARFEESLRAIGVRLRTTSLDWNALNLRKNAGDFDALALGWAPPYESDPGQAFHSSFGNAERKGSNFIGFADPETDRLIDAGRAELDPQKRAAWWRLLHARLHEMQPYLFAFNPPRKFVMNRAVRGFGNYALDPNYVIRRWFYAAGTPGTRAQLARDG